jgi:Uma2 family endonuclease
MLLAIEILSPRSARTDRVRKRRLYQRAGVPEYWIFDADLRGVERWRPGDDAPEIADETLVWQPDPEKPALTIALGGVFGEAIEG